MILSMSNQAALFFTTVLIGFSIGFLYDWIRIFRNIIKHANFIVQIEDALYWIAVSIGMFIIMLNKNYGEIRAFSICGFFIGMIIYFFTLSHLFMHVSMTVVSFIKKVIIMTVRIILTPVRLILKLLSYPYNIIKGFLSKLHNSNKKVLKKYKLCAKIKKNKLLRELKIIMKKV